jgi:glycosyltransferase involved in cell wall biosynthesis
MRTQVFNAGLGELGANPTASIVICNYNHGRFVEGALQSAVGQTFPCQVVVVDDGSTDESHQILDAWRDKVSVVFKQNGGQRSAYNVGFEKTIGDVVLFLDADDRLDANAVAETVAALTPGVSRIHFRLQLIDEAGEPLGGKIPRHLASGDLSPRLQRAGELPPSAPGSGNAYRRAALQRLMPLPVSVSDRHAADFFTIYGTSVLGDVVALDKTLGQYRVLSESRAATETSMIFGNAAQQYSRVIDVRIGELRQWLNERTGGQVNLPPKLLDFGELKGHFANKVFNNAYLKGLWAGSSELPDLVRSVFYRNEFSKLEKACLVGWALAILVAPRSLGRPIARFVVNPASRPS